jgi:2-deoxy-D-gluconate 3-dehydrogenase
MILDQFKLDGRHALVVGGAGDLGKAILQALVQAGAKAVVIDLSPQVHDIAAELKQQGHQVHALQVDITDRQAIKNSVQHANELLGDTIDILVNSAGIQRRTPSENFSEDDWDDVINVNLTAAFIYCQQVARPMIAKGYGKIINIASMQSFLGGITIPAYAASKGGIAQLTKALSNDWSAKGINVNAIAPGYIDTRLNVALINDPVRHAEALSRIPKKRWGVGDDLQGLAVFLASAASDYVCGSVIPVDGGYLAR